MRLTNSQHMLVQWYEELFTTRTLSYYSGKGHPSWIDPELRVSISDLLQAGDYLELKPGWEQWFWSFRNWKHWKSQVDLRFQTAAV